MKMRSLWVALPAVALMTGSCGKKEEAAAPVAPAPVAEQPAVPTPPVAPAPAPAPAPVIPALTAEERAAKFGIVKHLPKDTESFITVYNGSKTSQRFKGTKLWSLIEEASGGALDLEEELAPEEDGEAAIEGKKPEPAAPVEGAGDLPKPEVAAEAPPAEEEEEVASGPGALLGQEVFLATGKSTSAQTANLATLNRRSTYFQMKFLTKILLSSIKEDGMAELPEAMSSVQTQAIMELVKDPQSGLSLFENMQMPPLYVGFKTLPADREQVALQVSSMIDFMGNAEDMVEPLEFERAGAKFVGYRLLGDKIAKYLGEDREEMDEAIGAEVADQLIASIAKKNLIAVSGTLGDYVILFLGTNPDDCQLVADAKDSLAATDSLAFADAYASKDLAALLYGSDAMMDTFQNSMGGLVDVVDGVRDGLAGGEGLGDTRDLEALLQLVGEREQALSKLASADTYGLVSFFEEGMKVETFGGGDSGALDWEAKPVLGGLGESSDVVLFANFTSETAYDEKAKAYAESLVEATYAVAKKVSEVPVESEELKQFKDGMKLFDEKFRVDTLSLLEGLRGGFASGLGNESAIVVDLKGSVPTIPGIPQVLVDKGRFIRASWITPVTDRSKVSDSWDKMNESTTKILKTISEMTQEEIPMQKPMSSEKNGYTTWFFSMPFFNDDFVPSVTVGDKWFIASSSKLQALELADAAGKKTTDRTGFWLSVKLDPLRSFGADWLKLVDENSAQIFADEERALEKFQTNKAQMEKALLVLGDFDSITANVRRESGKLRGSIHFKTR